MDWTLVVLNRRTCFEGQILFFVFVGVMMLLQPLRTLAEESISFGVGSVLLADASGALQVRVATQSNRTVEAFVLSEPDRLVVDITGPDLKRREDFTPVSTPSVLKVRFGHHPEKLRIVFDLQSGMVLQDMEIPLTQSGVEHSYIIADGRISNAGRPESEISVPQLDEAVAEVMAPRAVRPPVFNSFPSPGLKVTDTEYQRKTPLQTVRTATIPVTDAQLGLPGVLPRIDVASTTSEVREPEVRITSPADDTPVSPLTEEVRVFEEKPPVKDVLPGDGFEPRDPAQTLQALFDEGQSGPGFSVTDMTLFILLGLLLLVLVATRTKQRRIRLMRDRLFPNDAEVKPAEDYYAVLGCAQDASNSTIKSRYRHLVKVYHRDSLEHETVSEEVRRLSESQLVRVHEAYKQVRQERGF